MFLVHGFVLIGLLVVGSLRSWWSRLTTKVIQLSLLVSPLGFRHFSLYFSLARGHIKKKNKTARDNDGSEACIRVGWWCVHFRSNQGSSLGYFVMLFLSSRLQICAMYAYSSITECFHNLKWHNFSIGALFSHLHASMRMWHNALKSYFLSVSFRSRNKFCQYSRVGKVPD